MTEHTIAPNLGNATMRRISNSESATWNNCERKYYYEFDLAVEPKQRGTALGRGILLHEILAFYYDAIKRGEKHVSAVNEARSMLLKHMNDPGFAVEVVLQVDKMLKGYWDFYKGDPNWRILHVEKSYDLAITPSYEYSLRLDLFVEDLTSGAHILVDHKTAYNFWKSDDLELSPQFPKYIGALRANGHRVDYAILNQLRTREIKAPTNDQLWQRTRFEPSKAKVANAFREHILTSEQIVKHRSLPMEARANTVTRVLNKQICQYCDMKPLCLSEYDGGDITHMLTNDFQPRTYGYNAAATDMDALL